MHIRVQHGFTTMYNEKYVSIEHERTNGTRGHEYMRMRVILSSTRRILHSTLYTDVLTYRSDMRDHRNMILSQNTKSLKVNGKRLGELNGGEYLLSWLESCLHAKLQMQAASAVC